ncbi:cytochrome P450 [Aspergillus sclerotioniger CBS 115572]|uniref:Cytochrome P450 n=1 Tax=Aspergillus sclerotioniger CBS 115572 TaxID=1450535 RepID=A0A317WSD1_9EURO|nr:cytochrome P450 [Aspergillus sclerotioniger CBS 115572]PWY88641.1 cytochrome P450 [Aspergillus sclerotioniger CBS 115572]
MSSQQFYLLGESVSSAKDITIETALDFDQLKQLVAAYFAIVDPNGIGFQTEDDCLSDVSDVLAAKGPVAIAIDGHAVREPGGPRGLPYVGNYFEVYPDHLGNHQRLFDQYGPIFKTTNLGRTTYQTNDPELSAIVFAESDFFSKKINDAHPLSALKTPSAGVFLGDTDTPEWKAAHKFLPPALGPKAVRHYAPTMQRAVEDSFKVFDALDEQEKAWNVYQYMLKLGSQAVGELTLGLDFKHFTSPDAPVHEMVHSIAEMLSLNKKVTSKGDWYGMLPFGDPQRLRNLKARIEEMVDESIQNAEQAGISDLPLQDAALQSSNMVDYAIRATDNKGEKLPKSSLVWALVVATAAGFTTTSSLLSWLIYGLVTYPGMQERLLQELIDNDITEDTELTADLTEKLLFQDKYIKEMQRRHNPSFQPGRTAKVDLVLPGGYKIPKDAVIIPALHHIHNNPNLWDNPTRFDPDRWDTPEVKARHKAAYIPFAMGPRMCIGFNFALQEIKVFLPKLIYRYHFSREGDGPIEYDPMFQLIRPNNLLAMRPTWSPPHEYQSRPVTVLGAGVLGRRIGCIWASAGYNVHLRDPSPDQLAAGIAYIQETVAAYASKTGRSPGKAHSFTDLKEAVSTAWLIIEAVPEKLPLKIATFAELSDLAPADSILASNSSSYKTSEMLDRVPETTKSRILNMHYYMPPQCMLVELMTDGFTSEDIFPFLVDRCREGATSPYVARKQSTGFIFNRLWAAVKREVLTILSEGVSAPEEIDAMWEEMFITGRVKPCVMMDNVGLDTVAFIEQHYIHERGLPSDKTVDYLTTNYLDHGKLGSKSPLGGLYHPVQSSTNTNTNTNKRLLILDIGLASSTAASSISTPAGHILSLTPPTPNTTTTTTTTQPQTILSNQLLPDGITYSATTNLIFWTCMGVPGHPDGAIYSSTPDGQNIRSLLPKGTLNTPKQITLDPVSQKLYFCDREGCAVYRCNLDGSELTTLVSRGPKTKANESGTSSSNFHDWCVGITVAPRWNKFYWTQKGPSKSGQGRIFCASLDTEPIEGEEGGQCILSGLPEPIDLEVDEERGELYWTDRGELPLGNSLNRVKLDKEGVPVSGKVEVLVRNLREAIGVSLDRENGDFYLTDLGGCVYRWNRDEKKKEKLYEEDGRAFTGIMCL